MRLLALTLIAACGPAPTSGGDDTTTSPDAAMQAPDARPVDPGPDAAPDSFTIYAHADHVLYRIDLVGRTLETVGNFNAPQVPVGNTTAEDVITDLAVGPDNVIWAVSETALYTVSANDGHVTQVGSLSACGTKTVALTATDDGKIYAGDFNGSICRIDTSQSPPVVEAPVTMSGGLALTGDMVAVGNGTVFGTAYRLSDGSGQGSQLDNLLVTVDPATGATTVIGASGYPKLFGASFGLGQVFGFSHDGTGDVVTIDRATGAGTLFATFNDPGTGTGIKFAGAGVNATVIVN